jgi:TP901 family phage tail tape measure protein
LAAAGGTSLETAATIAGNALNTFSLKGSDMNAVAAAMAGAANASTASIESLGEALSQVGPGAATAGLTLNDTVGVLAAFDNAGIKGSDAGTSLKTMLTRLVPTTKAAREAMRELGLKFTDASGQFLPITNVAEQLRLKLSKLSDEQRTQALSTIFGSDATRAATVLMKEGAAGIEGYIKATKDQNAAQEAANAGMKGTAGAVENFKGAIETAKIEIGQLIAPAVQAGLGKLAGGISKIGPAIRGVIALIGKGDFTKDFREAFDVAEDSPIVASLLNLRTTVGQVFSELKSRISPIVRDLVDGFKNLVPPVVEFARNLATDLLPPAKEIGRVLLGVALVVAGAVAGAFKSVTGFVKENSTLFQTLAVAVLAGVAAYKAYQGALLAVQLVGKGVLLFTKAWAVAQAALNFVMSANPIGIVVIAIAALAAGLVYAYKHSETFRKIVDGAFNGAKTVVLAVVGALVTAFKAVVKAFQAVGSAIGVAIDWIKGAFESVKSGVSAAVSFVGKVWSTIVAVLMAPVNLFLTFLGGVWKRISPILVLPFYIANAAINAVWNLIKAGFNAAWTWVSTNFVKGWNKTRDILAGPITTAKNWIAARWTDVRNGFSAAATWVTTSFSKAWTKTRDTIHGPINTAKQWVAQRWTDIRNGFSAAKDWVTGAWSKTWNTVKTTLSKPIADAKAQIAEILGGGKSGLQTVFRGAVKAIGVIWDTIKGVMKSPVKFVIDIVLNDGLISGFNWIANKFKAPTIPRIPLPPGFAEGGQFSGRLPGQPSAVDNMLGMSAAGPVALATGEYIVNARDTARSLPLLEHINSGGQLPGFADGGLFGKLKSAISSGFNAGKEFGKDALGFLGNPIDWFKKRFAGPLNRLNELGDSTLAQTVKAMPKRAADAIIDGAKSLLGLGGDGAGGFNASLGGVLNFVRSQVGKPYVWGGVGPGGYDCSGLVSAAINVALGRNPYSRIGATGSMPWSMFAPGLGAFSVGWFKGNPGHTAATVNGINIESRGGRGVLMGPSARGATNPLFTNRAHVKGFAQGGLLGDPPFDLLSKRGKAFKPEALLFDNGGVLPTGVSTVVNNTGKPEPLYREALTREDMDGMAFVLDVPSVGVLTGHIDARADSRITAANKQTKRRVGQGVRK